MRLLFLIADPDNDPLGLAIAVSTRKPNATDPAFCHVETYSDLRKRCWSATRQEGIRWTDSPYLVLPERGEPGRLPNLWTEVMLPHPESPEWLAYLDSLCGSRYSDLNSATSAVGASPGQLVDRVGDLLHVPEEHRPQFAFCSRCGGLAIHKSVELLKHGVPESKWRTEKLLDIIGGEPVPLYANPNALFAWATRRGWTP
jgi:hypothetical protein